MKNMNIAAHSLVLIVGALTVISQLPTTQCEVIYGYGVHFDSENLSGAITISKYTVDSDSDSEDQVSSGSTEVPDVFDNGSNSTESSEPMTSIDMTDETDVDDVTVQQTTVFTPSEEELKTIVVVEFRNITEIDMNGEKVGENSTSMHSYDSFSIENFALVSDDMVENEYLGLSAMTVIYRHPMTTLLHSTLQVKFYIITEEGGINMEDVNQALSEGDIIMQVEIQNWDWCDDDTVCYASNATTEMGNTLAMYISIQGTASTVEEEAHQYYLGPGQTLQFFTKIMTDGEWVDISASPQLSHDSTFIMNLPMFQNTSKFDVLLRLKIENDSEITGAANSMYTLAYEAIAVLLVAIQHFS